MDNCVYKMSCHFYHKTVYEFLDKQWNKAGISFTRKSSNVDFFFFNCQVKSFWTMTLPLTRYVSLGISMPQFSCEENK